MGPGRGVAPLAAMAAALAVAGCGSLGRAELKREVLSLQALAAEGRILARESTLGRSHTPFVRVHARELADDADHSARKLSDATPGHGLEASVQRAVNIASAESDALGVLETAPYESRNSRRAARELLQLSHAAERLAEKL